MAAGSPALARSPATTSDCEVARGLGGWDVTDETPIQLHPAPPETVLPAPPPEAAAELASALGQDETVRRDAVAAVAGRHPRLLEAWAALGGLARDDVEAYAYYRVGYHRGLDALRQAGWRGTGFVRSTHPDNRGFLDCLAGLAAVAGRLGEQDEHERCRHFLADLDPARPGPAGAAGATVE